MHEINYLHPLPDQRSAQISFYSRRMRQKDVSRTCHRMGYAGRDFIILI